MEGKRRGIKNLGGDMEKMKKGFKRKGIQVGTVFLISLLLMGSILVVGASGDDYAVENFYVDEDTAWRHAVVYLAEFVANDAPGLEDWDGATVQKDPVTVYDIHGKKLFYEFAVTKDGKAIGEVEISASKVLGSSLRRVIMSSPLDRESAAQKAIEIAEKEYPDYKISSTKPVCYSYPKEGVMVTLAKPGAKEEKTIIIEIYASSVVPLKEPEKEGELGAWSIYGKLSAEERAERVEKWNSDAKFVNAHQISENPGAITDQSLNDYSDRGSRGSFYLYVPLYAQLTSYWCAPATGQMIAKYHGYTHSQAYVAACMGTTSSGTTMQGQLNYYRNYINKPNSWYDDTPTWDKAVSEINAGRPLKSGISGHARCCRGWWFTGSNFYLLINDPYPPFIGLIYLENWDWVYHTNYIYVK